MLKQNKYKLINLNGLLCIVPGIPLQRRVTYIAGWTWGSGMGPMGSIHGRSVLKK